MVGSWQGDHIKVVPGGQPIFIMVMFKGGAGKSVIVKKVVGANDFVETQWPTDISSEVRLQAQSRNNDYKIFPKDGAGLAMVKDGTDHSDPYNVVTHWRFKSSTNNDERISITIVMEEDGFGPRAR